jgi:hypothetical protein
MKQGRTLQELAIELDRQNKVKRDFIADTRQLKAVPITEAVKDAMPEPQQAQVVESVPMAMQVDGQGVFPMTETALQQVGGKLDIPAKYVRRLANDHPDLLAHNFNQLFEREPKKHMVRTLDGRHRAFLSDRYRCMDNFDLSQVVLSSFLSHQGIEITSCEVTERRLYIKAVRADLQAELPPPAGHHMGDGTHTFFVQKIQAGICVMNSEIGYGALQVQPATFTQACTNYATFQDTSFRKMHLGKKLGGGEMDGAWELFSDDTRAATDRALWQQITDIVNGAIDGTIFDKIVSDLKTAQLDQMEKPAPDVVEVVGKKLGIGTDEGGGILNELIRGGDLSRYGLHNAITRYSQQVDDYDRATELERAGGQVIEMRPSEWQAMAKVA